LCEASDFTAGIFRWTPKNFELCNIYVEDICKNKKWQKQKWVGLPAVPRWLSAVVAQALL
jgi:hypothetical protein